ncbi:MAG: CoA pyrophosphatase [Deltaproteobacteria bacterium]|nr:CoA pyrophosphatase [Deltaproteobacteria bacterium]
MDLNILTNRDGFRREVIAALAGGPLDYLEQLAFMKHRRNTPERWEGAGVLLLLHFPDDPGDGYRFLLNKRSARVKQGGDLCAPGGGPRPFLDRLTQKLLQTGLLPGSRGPGFRQARARGGKAYRKILFFLATALRESWEEMGLSPFNIEFLGPLRTQRLLSRNWVIFPLVGRVKRSWRPRLSWEVERLVSIPLRTFFQPENYALYFPELGAPRLPGAGEFPCLVYDAAGREEILWGATYRIIRSFLKTVLPLPLPSPDGGRVVRRPLVANYFSGSRGS